MLLKPNAENICFGCGGANGRGMQLTFEQDDATRSIRGSFRLGPEYQGGPGFIHGGIIATVLDEVMGKVSRFRGVHAVTAELTIEYLKPVVVDTDLVVEGREVGMTGRNLHMSGEIRDAAGQILARGKGRFVVVGAKQTAQQAAPEELAGKPLQK
ncbi:MAG: PaaI family thioesterase [Candidatus Acidiferrales bacterium]